MRTPDRRHAKLVHVRAAIAGLYRGDLQTKQIELLAGAVLGVMQAASQAVAMIGQALAKPGAWSASMRLTRWIDCSATMASTCETVFARRVAQQNRIL